MLKIKNRVFLVLSLILILTVFINAVPSARAAGETPDIEVLLSADAVSNNLDLAGFSDKLKAVLQNNYSIPADKVHVTEVESKSYSGDSSGWYRFDHTNISGNQADDEQNKVVYFNDTNMPSPVFAYHIVRSGDAIEFNGYGHPAFKDFLFMPNADANNKIFTFTIDESAVQYHSCEGAGFLFNAKYDYNSSTHSRTLSGYLILIGGLEANPASGDVSLFKLENIDVNLMTQEDLKEFGNFSTVGATRSINTPVSVWGGTLTRMASIAKPAISAGTNRYLKLVASPTNVSLTQYEDSDFAAVSSTIFNNISITNLNSFGFGPFVAYRGSGHTCSRLTKLAFKNLKMVAESSVGFADIVKSTAWQYEDSLKIIANVDNNGVPDFGNTGKLSSILYYMMLNNVHYAGWGLNSAIDIGGYSSVLDQTEGFIQRNNGKGLFINRTDSNYDSLDEGISQLAGYIDGQLDEMPEIENPEITAALNGGGSVTCTAPDMTSAGNPVGAYIWRTMNVQTGVWNESDASGNTATFTFAPNTYNYISLQTQDSVTNEWSDYSIAYVANDPSAPPIAQFSVSPAELIPDSPIPELRTGTVVTAADSSYHPSGDALTEWDWHVFDSSLKEITSLARNYTSESKPEDLTFDFSSLPGGSYTIKLRVKKGEEAGWSDYFSQKVGLLRESDTISIARTAPEGGDTVNYEPPCSVSAEILSANTITAYRFLFDPVDGSDLIIGDWSGSGSTSVTASVSLAGGDHDVYLQARDSVGFTRTSLLGTFSADTDGDGYLDSIDLFPNDPQKVDGEDFDGDGIDNVFDPDDDNDGVIDGEDGFPLDPTKVDNNDFDADGLDDIVDTDDDNDGFLDTEDSFPKDPQKVDGTDTDSDGFDDKVDDDPADPNHVDGIDYDSDGIDDAVDSDDDNDGVPDEIDDYPLDPLKANGIDTDGDGTDDLIDTDDDNDGFPDQKDKFPLDGKKVNGVDTDSDGIDDLIDTDDDNDGVLDKDENRSSFKMIQVRISGSGKALDGSLAYVYKGNDYTLTLIPNEGYYLSSVRVNGFAEKIEGNSVVLKNVTSDLVIDVEFSKITSVTEMPPKSGDDASLAGYGMLMFAVLAITGLWYSKREGTV